MSEHVSSGLNGEVYTIDPKDKKLFPQADLVKATCVSERSEMLMPFYVHKIGELLVPESSLRVIATYFDPTLEIKDGRLINRFTNNNRDYPIKVLTTEVVVHPDHSNFSAHSTRGHFLPEFGASWKSLECKHQNCHNHNDLHRTKEWNSKFKDAQRKYKEVGIKVPETDATDWCLDQNGQIVFFEFEHLDHKRLYDYLTSLKNPNQNQKRAYQLLLRYEKLFYEHYKDWELDEPTRPEELTFSLKSLTKTAIRKVSPFS